MISTAFGNNILSSYYFINQSNQKNIIKMEQKEKLRTVGSAMKESIKIQSGEYKEKIVKETVERAKVDEIVREWPETSRIAVEHNLQKYGLPNEATQSRFVWYNNGPWKRTVITWQEIPHNFPAPHVDVIENFIDYKIPLDKYNEIAEFDGSIIIERTKGEVSARCDSEAANFIALNLMHQILSGKMNVKEAKEAYGEAMSAHLLDRPTNYDKKLVFDPPNGKTRDLDEMQMADEMLHQMVEKARDEISGK